MFNNMLLLDIGVFVCLPFILLGLAGDIDSVKNTRNSENPMLSLSNMTQQKS